MGSVSSCRGRTSRRPCPSSSCGFETTRPVVRTWRPAAGRTGSGVRQCAPVAAFELTNRRLWQGKACGHQTSVTAGTVRHRTRIALPLWGWAAYTTWLRRIPRAWPASNCSGRSAHAVRNSLGPAPEAAPRPAPPRPGPVASRGRSGRERHRGPRGGDARRPPTPRPGAGRGRRRGPRPCVWTGSAPGRPERLGRRADRLRPGPRRCGGHRADGWLARVRLPDGSRPCHRPRTQRHPARAERILPRVHRLFGNLATSRPGPGAPITVSALSTSKATWTSSPSGSTGAAPRWPRFRRSWVSPPCTDPRPTTGCMVRSEPDKQ